MRRIISMLFLMSLSLAGMAQDRTTRQQRIDQWKNDMSEFRQRSAPDRAAQAMIDTLTWHQAGASINAKSFVLEAESPERGLDPRGVVQISPSRMVSGPNGVGGITLDGLVSGFTVTTGRKGVVHVHLDINGAGISAQADISLYPGSDEAHAIISPNFNSQTIRLEGRIVPYGQSRVYEGMSL